MNTQIGNILDVDRGVIVHGCNLQGRMGSGIALQIKNRWPKVFEAYVEECKLDMADLGKVGFVWVGGQKIIANAYTQRYYGNDGKRYVDYDAIRSCFEIVLRTAKVDNLPIHYPKIGAGLGGGDWEIISGIIEEVLKNHEHYLWLLKPE